ncbi:MAG: hypothetical protein IPJ30_25555 [Acidobacteria bacterium]|nr:hypothetical protein [Acidobacteriota bacterium]
MNFSLEWLKTKEVLFFVYLRALRGAGAVAGLVPVRSSNRTCRISRIPALRLDSLQRCRQRAISSFANLVNSEIGKDLGVSKRRGAGDESPAKVPHRFDHMGIDFA